MNTPPAEETSRADQQHTETRTDDARLEIRMTTPEAPADNLKMHTEKTSIEATLPAGPDARHTATPGTHTLGTLNSTQLKHVTDFLSAYLTGTGPDGPGT